MRHLRFNRVTVAQVKGRVSPKCSQLGDNNLSDTKWSEGFPFDYISRDQPNQSILQARGSKQISGSGSSYFLSAGLESCADLSSFLQLYSSAMLFRRQILSSCIHIWKKGKFAGQSTNMVIKPVISWRTVSWELRVKQVPSLYMDQACTIGWIVGSVQSTIHVYIQK
jgi:hypothetical protein